MKIDLPTPPGKDATMEQISAYLNRLREMILYLAEHVDASGRE